MIEYQTKQITILVGLPGSGKTHYGRELIQGAGGIFIDDVDKNSGLNSITQAIRDGVSHIVLADPHLCKKDNQVRAIRFFNDLLVQFRVTDYKIKWIYFENNPEKCMVNVTHRMKQGDDRLVSQSIQMWADIYYIPEGAQALTIWQPKKD